VSVVIVLAAAVILGGVVVVAMGRGGELSRERPELPARSDFRTWSDVARYRPPGALLGYHAGATEHALSLIARTIAERDAEIDWLRRRLAEVSRPQAAPDGQGSGEAGFVGSPAGSAPGFESEPADDAALEGNAHVRPTLSLGPRPGEGE
jgi:hypothetical protein